MVPSLCFFGLLYLVADPKAPLKSWSHLEFWCTNSAGCIVKEFLVTILAGQETSLQRWITNVYFLVGLCFHF